MRSMSAAPSPAISALRHASATTSSEPVLESKADPDAVVEIALLVPAGFPAQAPGGARPMHAVQRHALGVRDLHDAGRDGLRFLAKAGDERDAVRVAVVAVEAQEMAEVGVADAGDLCRVERVAEAVGGDVLLDRGRERIDVGGLVASVTVAQAKAPGVGERATGLE